MRDEEKTKRQLISELNKLRQLIGEHFNIPQNSIDDDDFHSLREASQHTKTSQDKFMKSFLQNSIPMGLTTQKEGSFVEVSDAFLKLMGFKRAEVLGNTSTALGLITEEQRSIVINEFIKKGKVENLELQVRSRNGNLIYGLFNAVMMSLGKEKYLLTVMTDITERKLLEEELILSEKKYRDLFESVPIGIFRASPEGRCLDANPFLARLLGYDSPEDLIESVTDIGTQIYLNPENRNEFFNLLTTHGYLQNYEAEFIQKTGNIVWGSLNAKIVRDGAGNILYSEGISQDITNRKLAEKMLLQSERKYREVVENLNEGIWAIDKDAVTTFVNSKMSEMLGYSESEMLGRHLFSFMDHQGIEKCKQHLDHRRQGVHEIHEFEFLRKDGSHIVTQLTTGPITDEDGRYMGAIAGVMDITDRKEIGKKSKDMLSFLQTLFNTIPSPIFCKDVNCLYVDCNKEFERYTGFERKDIIGKSVYDMYTQEVADKYHEMDLALFRQPGKQIYEYPIIYADGNRHDVVVNKATYQNADGTVAGLVGVMVDITERKRIEEDLLANQEKYRFLIRNTSDYVARYSLSGDLLFASDGIQFMLGYKPQEVIGTSGLDRVHPDDRSIVQEALKKALETAQGTDRKIEYRTLRQDGSYLWVELSGKTVWNNQTGKMEVIATVRNINDRRQAENELAQYRERLEHLVEERTQDLENKTKALEEINIALKVLLQHREEDKKELEDRFVVNVKNLIIPFVEKIKNTNLDERQLAYIGIIEAHLKDITSTMIKKFNQLNLTPTEVEVASLIKEGKATKEIAKIMGSATSSIDTHRNNIRKKLGINKENVNLRSYLQSFD